MKKYIQKNLGYKRVETNAMYRVTMPDNSKYDVPVQIIADSRDEYYKDDEEDTIKNIVNSELDEDMSKNEINDWASNNMNWEDVEDYAVKLPKEEEETDFQEGWINGDNEIIGKI